MVEYGPMIEHKGIDGITVYMGVMQGTMYARGRREELINDHIEDEMEKNKKRAIQACLHGPRTGVEHGGQV